MKKRILTLACFFSALAVQAGYFTTGGVIVADSLVGGGTGGITHNDATNAALAVSAIATNVVTTNLQAIITSGDNVAKTNGNAYALAQATAVTNDGSDKSGVPHVMWR